MNDRQLQSFLPPLAAGIRLGMFYLPATAYPSTTGISNGNDKSFPCPPSSCIPA